MLVHVKEIMERSMEEGYAVGAFNAHNLESIIGICRAAEALRSPAIIQFSEGAVRYIGLKNVYDLVKNSAEIVAPNAAIALHLDHGKSIGAVFECIEIGFSSVHIDASHMPLDQNINATKQVVEVAHKKGVWVQGEVGAMVGGHGKVSDEEIEIPIAKLEDVISFVEGTGVDEIAAAIGTAHGTYKNEKIDFPLLKDIKNAIKIPFVLHGGSGVKEEEIEKAIRQGVNIINIGTDIKVAFCKTLIDECLENRDETDPRKLLKPAIQAVEETVRKSIELFGSKDKAR